MNKKILIICCTIIFISAIVIIAYIFVWQKNHPKDEVIPSINNQNCIPFSGGSFDLIFNTNGGNEIANMDVGIAVNPDSYEDLPTPVKDGYIFEGWYYDERFESKVNITNSIDITPVPEYDKNKCMTGYKDIELFAKWSRK